MLPGFSAEAGLAVPVSGFAARVERHTAAQPSSRQRVATAVDGRGKPGQSGDAPTTRYCPCCVWHNGRLVCC